VLASTTRHPGATRDSFVGVAGGFGTVVLGNLTGPTRALGGAVDVNSGATGIGANSALLGKLGNNLVSGTTATPRTSATCALPPPACRSSTTAGRTPLPTSPRPSLA
jgi:hypothetical protein